MTRQRAPGRRSTPAGVRADLEMCLLAGLAARGGSGNRVAVVSVALELWLQRDQFPGRLLGVADIPGDKTLLGAVLSR